MVSKGQYWKKDDRGHIWVRFIFEVEPGAGNIAHYLEYTPNGTVPHRDNTPAHHMLPDDDDDDFRPWTQISLQEAVAVIVNLDEQDERYAFRMGNKQRAESLAQALKIIEGRKVSSVDVRDNTVRISTDNGAEYEIAIDREGFTSRQTGLPDPW